MNVVTRGLGGRGLATFGLGKQLTEAVQAPRLKRGRSGAKFSRGYIIEVDDEIIWAATLQEALDILARITETAKELAEKIEKTTSPLRAVPRIRVLTASRKPTKSKRILSSLGSVMDAVNDLIEQANQRALINKEIGQLIHKGIEEDDEEAAIIALLM